jgi:hypothetical protein
VFHFEKARSADPPLDSRNFTNSAKALYSYAVQVIAFCATDRGIGAASGEKSIKF